jgi:molybdopterin-binding protein
VFETRRVRHGVTSNQPLRFSHQANKGVKMKLSARNQFRGKIVDVKKGSTTSHVRIDIGQGVIVTSSITNAAVADLDLRMGSHQSIGCDDRQIAKALCFSFGRHLAQQAPGQPNPISFLKRSRLFAELSSHPYDSAFNRPRSADRAAFKRSRNLFPDNRLTHRRTPGFTLGAAGKGNL